jgi:hypothetical protein
MTCIIVSQTSEEDDEGASSPSVTSLAVIEQSSPLLQSPRPEAGRRRIRLGGYTTTDPHLCCYTTTIDITIHSSTEDTTILPPTFNRQ